MQSGLNYFLINFLAFLILFVSLDIIIFFLIKLKVRWINIIITGIIYVIFLCTIFIFYLEKLTSYNIFEYINAELVNNLNNVLAKELNNGVPQNEIENIRLLFDMFIIKVIPGWIIISVMLMVFLNYIVVRLFVINKYKIINEMLPFNMWYLNEKVIWIFIFGLFLFLIKNFIKNEIIYSVAINILFVFSNLYFLIGLSLNSYFFEKFKVPVFLQILFYISVLLWNFLTVIIILTGILDTWFNLRKIQKGGR
jgi:uncharacterized protein YybS (DUF2232 family)